jgi:hypothetical protein
MIRDLILASASALALVACSPQGPAAPVEGEVDQSSPGMELPVAAELLAGPPMSGTWTAIGDGADVGVRFAGPDYPDTLTIGCNEGSGRVFINWTVQNPTEDGEVRVYTLARTETFASTGSNDDGAMRAIDVEGADPRLAALKVPQTVFGVQASGEAIVVPWDPQIAATLDGCAA